MLRFLVVRIASALGVVVMVTTVTWVMIHTFRAEEFQFDQRPVLEQFLDFMNRAFLHFDWGRSQGVGVAYPDVAEMLRHGIPQDLQLLGGGLALGLFGGMAAGTYCAAHPRSPLARLMETTASFFLCAPPYVVGLSLLLLFGEGIETIDIGIGIPTQYVPFEESKGGWLGSMIAPWIVLALPFGAFCLRMMSGQLHEVAGEQYLRTARAKGLPEHTVWRRHAIPPAAAPVFSLAGASIPLLVTNMVLVEHVFSVPGVFQNLTESLDDGDFPVILGMTAVAAALVSTASIIVDVALAWLDPVVRQGKRSFA